jgi:quinolinate synthase
LLNKSEELVEKIQKLKKEKKAIILAHNYQRPEIQEVADYVDDSVGLARRAMEEKEAKIIVHCSVDFMAETAVLLNPEKKVLNPSLGAKCPMAAMLPAFQVQSWKSKYPKIPIVLYVNTHAEAKAHCDICCTSANAVKIVESLNSDKVIFGPDSNLAKYVQKKTGKTIIPIPERGFCQTHVLFLKEDVLLLKEKNPDAVTMIHPECTLEVQETADYIGSTSQMCKYAKESAAKKFIVGTEVGLLHRLKKENPQKIFIPAYEDAWCVNMKLTTLPRVLWALKEERHLITVPQPVIKKARQSLEKMFQIAG